MAELNWKYAQNTFLSTTDNRRPLMLVIGADHTAKLAAKVGSTADPDIQACIDRAQPAFDNFQLKMVTYDIVSGTRKGQTEMLGDLLKELSSTRIKQWDITIQNTYINGTPQYTQILPDGRKPFQQGGQDMRILAVQTLAQALAGFPEFSALRTTVETFHASLQAARNTQQGSEGEIATASAAAEDARIALAIAMFANVGRLMEKHAADPDRLGDYFEVGLLRSGGGGGTEPEEPGLDQPTGLQLQAGPMNSVIANWNAVTDATNYEVEKQLVGTDPDFSVIGSTGSTTHQFGGFSGGSTVRVRIRAFGTTGPSGTPTSPYSEVAEITFP